MEKSTLKKRALFFAVFVTFCALFYFGVLFIFQSDLEGESPQIALAAYGLVFLGLTFLLAMVGEVALDRKNLTLKKITRAWSAAILLLFLTLWKPFITSDLFRYACQGHQWHHHPPLITLSAEVEILISLIVYLWMTCAAWLVWRKRGLVSEPLAWYYAQLALTTAHLPTWYYSQSPLPSAAWTILIFLCAVQTTRLFFKENWYAGELSIPYLIFSLHDLVALAVSWFV